MQKKKAFIIIFSVLLLTCFFVPVKAIDSYGNQLTDCTIYQRVGDSNHYIDSFTNDTYVENANYSLINWYSPFYFNVGGLLNTTLSNYENITYTMGYGIQVFQEETYENAMSLIFPTYQTGGFWIVDAVSETIDNSINLTAICNVTVWINYQNGSGWLEIEEYLFNLTCDTPQTTEEPVTDEIELNIIWFWLFIISMFSTSIHGVLAFKQASGTYATICLISFAFTISFLAMLSG